MKPFLTFVLLALVTSASGFQRPAAPVKQQQPLSDFDVRELAIPEIARLRAESAGVVQRRTAALADFVRTSEEVKLGTRVVPNQYGLPKVYLRDGHSLNDGSLLPTTDIAKG